MTSLVTKSTKDQNEGEQNLSLNSKKEASRQISDDSNEIESDDLAQLFGVAEEFFRLIENNKNDSNEQKIKLLAKLNESFTRNQILIKNGIQYNNRADKNDTYAKEYVELDKISLEYKGTLSSMKKNLDELTERFAAINKKKADITKEIGIRNGDARSDLGNKIENLKQDFQKLQVDLQKMEAITYDKPSEKYPKDDETGNQPMQESEIDKRQVQEKIIENEQDQIMQEVMSYLRSMGKDQEVKVVHKHKDLHQEYKTLQKKLQYDSSEEESENDLLISEDDGILSGSEISDSPEKNSENIDKFEVLKLEQSEKSAYAHLNGSMSKQTSNINKEIKEPQNLISKRSLEKENQNENDKILVAQNKEAKQFQREINFHGSERDNSKENYKIIAQQKEELLIKSETLQNANEKLKRENEELIAKCNELEKDKLNSQSIIEKFKQEIMLKQEKCSSYEKLIEKLEIEKTVSEEKYNFLIINNNELQKNTLALEEGSKVIQNELLDTKNENDLLKKKYKALMVNYEKLQQALQETKLQFKNSGQLFEKTIQLLQEKSNVAEKYIGKLQNEKKELEIKYKNLSITLEKVEKEAVELREYKKITLITSNISVSDHESIRTDPEKFEESDLELEDVQRLKNLIRLLQERLKSAKKTIDKLEKQKLTLEANYRRLSVEHDQLKRLHNVDMKLSILAGVGSSIYYE